MRRWAAFDGHTPRIRAECGAGPHSTDIRRASGLNAALDRIRRTYAAHPGRMRCWTAFDGHTPRIPAECGAGPHSTDIRRASGLNAALDRIRRTCAAHPG